MSKSEESAERLLNMVLDEVDDMIIFLDSEHNIIWMNQSAQRKFRISPDKAVGMKCHKLFGCTCRCGNCTSDCMIGGPCNNKCELKITDGETRYVCTPIPYHKDGKLMMVVQHVKEKKQ